MPRSESEKMEVQDEAKKENQVFGTAGMAKFGVNGVNVMSQQGDGDGEDSGGPTLRFEDTRAVVIMNAHCIVQMANKSVRACGASSSVAPPALPCLPRPSLPSPPSVAFPALYCLPRPLLPSPPSVAFPALCCLPRPLLPSPPSLFISPPLCLHHHERIICR